MHKLVEYICDELEELERKADKEGKLSMAEVQYMDTLAHAKKNLLKGEEMMEDMEGGSSYMMDGGSSYRRGSSYRNTGSSYRKDDSSMAGMESGQSRARGRGKNVRRDSMGRYSSERGGSSYDEGMDNMIESIYSIMDELPENVKQDAQRFVKKLEDAM